MSLKPYEIARLGMEPFLLPLYRIVRTKLRARINETGRGQKILDVGGRKSPYTIGLDAKVTIIDLPRESHVQKALKLGLNNEILEGLKKRRSNIEEVLIGDITRSDLPSESFDIVVSVEVLEHVVEDELFVREVARILKPGGVFIMTTPNGDFLANNNPDHVRHYKKDELTKLLSKHLADVGVEYAVSGGRFRKFGLKAWSIKRPVATAASIFGNMVNTIQSSAESNKFKARGTHHLIAVARK